MTAMTQTYYMTGRHVRAFLRQPWFVAVSLVQPVIWLLLFGALFKSVTTIPGFGGNASYLDYLVPAVLVMTALFSCGWSGMGIIEDIDRGIMDRFLVSPVHRGAHHHRPDPLRDGRPARPGPGHRRAGPRAGRPVRRRDRSGSPSSSAARC